MARRKRRKHSPSPPPPPPRDDAFHTPFRHLKTLRQDVQAAAPSTPADTPAVPAQEPKPQQTVDTQVLQERALFLAEMADVTPLPPDRRGRVGKSRRLQRRVQDSVDHFEALADLRELVEGKGVFTIQYTDEYMEGVAPGVDRRLAQRLHQGDFSVQAHLDLHGYTVEEAKNALDGFLTNAYTTGRRCLRVVHGRGHNSPDNRPVLKEQVQFWLSHGRLSRLVLAFATAPAVDGGAGAVYVLLRRGPSHPRRK